MEKKYCTAIVLAAGQGRRMGTEVHKQYLLLGGRPVLYYSLHTFEASPLIDEIILVTGEGEEQYCKEEIVEKYGISKVKAILAGGAERYHSVWNGLCRMQKDGYVFVHDGARPFVDKDMIARAYEAVCAGKACVVGMPVKDTIKIADENGFVKETPKREELWMVQTPQVFDSELLRGAYAMLMRQAHIEVTDDAMVVEQMLNHPIQFVYGSYENIKITTPEDLEVAEVFAQKYFS
ncbi:2-C-methyl-D-erythritol 4-phosphate cytidylyltransferase [Mediterraneibacter sp. NSJ-55]|uniref:2-C-methyl-D-erythritol 4-phosphate cytidylyltransferase n=1 Tax=Mediterraneibacter hominis TaxID=2763054 RepID=A0A923RR02_9FIRM|nr:2-C-methyl-D-erythritol 4-phosphate cytidylyltransferase [Mediterraneibacter hominis]MBC5690119.1 2-C-methyl-D-erythritol 4-phosphate cytidylyltransferase [Mediterraneibacter hominis]